MELLIDPVGGISGDMFLGALLDLGLPSKVLVDIYKKLPVEINFKVCKGDLGTRVTFSGKRIPDPFEMKRIVDESSLKAKKDILKALDLIIHVEGEIHGSSFHLHEMGDIDTLGDLVGFFEGLEIMGFRRFYIKDIPLNWGGVIKSDHGLLPNPSPAALKILEGFHVKLQDGGENVTPTGAAIVRVLNPKNPPGRFKIIKSGIGEGEKRFPERPNILRLIHIESDYILEDNIYTLETHIDDMNPEVFPYIFDKAFERGALDVVLINALMKKGRPGFILRIIVDEKNLDRVVDLVLSMTTTLGLRISRERRYKVYRWEEEKEYFGEKIRVKKAMRKGFISEKIEFEDAKTLADKGIPIWLITDDKENTCK